MFVCYIVYMYICCIVCMCDHDDCVMVIRKPHLQIMQHMHTNKAVTKRIEAKKLFSLSLVKGNQTIAAIKIKYPQ